MATENLKVRSGNTIKVLLDGKEVGLLQQVRASDDYAPDAASGIGDIHVAEYVPTLARHSLTVSAMVLSRGALRAAGVVSENGEAALRGLELDIVVYDKLSGEELIKYVGCVNSGGDVEVSKHAVLMENATFLARDVKGVRL